MISFIRYLFHRSIPDPKIGQIWKCADFPDKLIITLSDIKDDHVQYYISSHGPLSEKYYKHFRELKSFYRLEVG